MRLTSTRAKQRASAEKFAYRRWAGEVVRRRWAASGNRCEGCGEVVDVVEVAHLFSRAGHLVDDHLSSTPELMMALCCARTWGDRVGCHELVDRSLDPELRDKLRWAAVIRLCALLGTPVPSMIEHDALGALREVVSSLAALSGQETTT